MAFDIIGDTHGHAEALTALLRHLGYRETRGAWRHPGRTAIFVGDFIDRGPHEVETVMTVRRMVDAGSAQAVMGNHELNAIAWFLPDPRRPGACLRAHDARNRDQHAAFLAAVDGKPALHEEIVRWFLTLPLWLDVPGLRVAHACGHPRFVDHLATRLQDARLTEELMPDVVPPADYDVDEEPDLTLHAAIEAVAKGPDVSLPRGTSRRDKDGQPRARVRVRWWDREATTYRTAAMPYDDDVMPLPDDEIPERVRPGVAGEGVHFFGHYWLTGEPRPLGERVACVDYSVARGGKLIAYRWDGETVLDAARFAWVGGGGVPT